MSCKIILPLSLRGKLSKFHPNIKSRIRAALDYLVDNPFEGKALQEEWKGYYSLRVDDYRIIYKINKDVSEILVFAIGHRKVIYQNLI